MDFSNVFLPGRIGALELRNRFVVPPMGTNYANMDGTVSPRLIDHYAGMAKGGFGLIIVEFTAVDPQGRVLVGQNALWADEQIDGCRRLVDEVHRHGAKIAVQLAHGGRQSIGAITGMPTVAPSPLPCPAIQEIPNELTTQEVHDLIGKFVEAAVRAKAAGFDAVEIHGAHGYLLAQFMSAYSNKRVDEFGGDLRSRMKLPVEIIKATREALGPEFPILFRMSHEEGVPGGRSTLESRIVAKIVEEAGVDAIDVAAGNYESLHLMAGGREAIPAYNVDGACEIKNAVSLPVIVAGRINDPLIAEDIIQSGKADFVALGRTSLADPEFPKKLAEGASAEIAPCISCSQGCVGYLFAGQPITCLVNPFCGGGNSLAPVPAAESKSVMIVGGGPGGLTAAWVAAKRGHKVSLYEKENVLGGQFRVGAIPPGRGEITKAVRHFILMGEKYGVDFHLGVEVTPELVASNKPDVLIVATGGVPLMPAIKGIDNPTLAPAAEILEGRKPMGGAVLVIGGSLVGLETADFISSYGRRVTVIDLIDEMGVAIDPYTKPFIMRRFHDRDVRMITGAKVTEVFDDGVDYETQDGARTLRGFDGVVLAIGYQAYNPLGEQVRDLVGELHVIGDAVQARNALEATAEAARVASVL